MMNESTRLMKKALIGGIAAIAIALTAAPVANAAPDPHIPEPGMGWCRGGGDGGGGIGFCDGVPYGDGSKWHVARGFIPFKGYTWKLSCVVDDGTIFPPEAMPGQCGGGW